MPRHLCPLLQRQLQLLFFCATPFRRIFSFPVSLSVAELLGRTRDIHLPPIILFRRIANLTPKLHQQQCSMESTLLSHFILLLSVHRYYRKCAQMFGTVSDERCCLPFGRTLRADLQQKIKQCAVTRSAVVLTFHHKKKTGALIQTWNLQAAFKPSLRCIKGCLDQFLMTAWSRLSKFTVGWRLERSLF